MSLEASQRAAFLCGFCLKILHQVSLMMDYKMKNLSFLKLVLVSVFLSENQKRKLEQLLNKTSSVRCGVPSYTADQGDSKDLPLKFVGYCHCSWLSTRTWW